MQARDEGAPWYPLPHVRRDLLLPRESRLGGQGPGLGSGGRSHPSPHVPPVELPQTALRVQILDYKLFSQHELPLGTVDPQPVLELWHPLGPPSTAR